MSRRIPLFFGLGLVVVIAGWYVALWSPQHSALKAALAKQATAVATQTQLSSELGQLRAIQRTLPAEATALRHSLSAFPVAASVDTIIDQINQIASASGVAWTNESQSVSGPTTSGVTTTPAATSSSSAAASTSSSASTVALTLTVSGSYQSVSSFISSLELMPRLIVISGLQYSPSAATVSASISGQAFYDPTPLPVVPSGAAFASSGG